MPEYLTDNESWLDLAIGETATVLGKLESVGYGPNATCMITFTDWTSLVIHVADPRALKPFPVGTLQAPICMRVRRTEDGVEAIAAWKQGCPPVPLLGEDA